MAMGKRVRVTGQLEYQTRTDKISGEPRRRAVIVASQVLFLDYDRVHRGLPEAPVAEAPAIEEVVQLKAERPAPRTQAA